MHYQLLMKETFLGNNGQNYKWLKVTTVNNQLVFRPINYLYLANILYMYLLPESFNLCFYWCARMFRPQTVCLAKVQCSFMIAVPSSFLRAVAYREFIRMVYGILGRRRIPLPACAYHEIRKKFPVTKDKSFTGFEMDEDDVWIC